VVYRIRFNGGCDFIGPPLEEADVVERARRGDADAYEELVRRYTEIAFRTACLVTGSAADAEEVTQDAFVKAWSALSRFQAGAPFRPWLLQIVGNEARNRRRATGRRLAMELRLAGGLRTSGATSSPEAEAVAAEERASLLRVLNGLPEDDRQVIACRHLLQLSVEETATFLALPEGTVKSRLHRALHRVRQVLEPIHG
jgi:RNA polymerase sigma-70 factor (ECF subfamily)